MAEYEADREVSCGSAPVAVLGPTASGKTALAIELAKRFHGEIISCDSMQVYSGLNIGTAKPKKEELEAVPHHLIGVVEPECRFSVADYVELAQRALKDIQRRGKRPFVVGGTGLYARALLFGGDFSEAAGDEKIRERLCEEAERYGAEQLHKRLFELDPAAAEAIHMNNVKRVVRALEYIELTGKRFSDKGKTDVLETKGSLVLCISFRERKTLYDRIEKRVDEMFEEGLLEEAGEFYERVKLSKENLTAAQAIGYKELFPYFEGRISLDEAKDNIKLETRHYAKRQLTWFRREKDAVFVYADDYGGFKGLFEACAELIENNGKAN